ncbi:FeoB-associated Cys-rich membrane protein [Enterococcus asini]|uniref:FeoB-associated Cys-rich membrane protein n=1 Tax=Enterococcus asini TaxID=57732 RepID=UPI00289262AB|nr:FeoB-associated Cys-rich membrane protein [Enterococcus asini]MDT2756026.1 FeoB-associated Cys-rich membrane protein [Enterococcus asini]
MFWTIVLSVIIFGGAAGILFRRLSGRSSSCEDCNCSCGVKDLPKQSNPNQ